MKRRANGDGAIYQRKKTKRWEAEINVTQADGTKKRVCISSKSKQVVQKRLKKIREQEEIGIPYSDKIWTVAEYLDYWMHDVQSSRIRETTKTVYSQVIKNHIKPTLGAHKLQNLRAHHIRCAFGLLDQRGCPKRTQQMCWQILSSCFSCAEREEIIHRNIVRLVEKPKYEAKETVIWTAEQAVHFLRTAQNHPQYIAFLLLLTYGMRRGEALGLRWCDIDFENSLIHLRQQIGRINGELMARDLKTKNSRRTLPLMPNIQTELFKHAGKTGGTIPPFNPQLELSATGTVVVTQVSTPVDPQNLTRSFRELTERAGLPHIKIHAMRHIAATILKELNVPVKDVQMILGHSNILTTLNIYQHGTPEAHRTAISAIENRLLGHQKNNGSFNGNCSDESQILLSGNKMIAA